MCMNWNESKKTKLISAFLALENPKECQAFLRDLMTEKEIEEFSNRLKAAEMLAEKVSYVEIVKATGLSSTTVARVAKWLNGKEQGYKSVLSKLHHTNSIQKRKGLS